jgi:hypothetical protein
MQAHDNQNGKNGNSQPAPNDPPSVQNALGASTPELLTTCWQWI